jgi:hypothetical protein
VTLSDTAREILEEFASRYPHSAHYQGGRKLRLGGWERRVPGTLTDVDEKEAFLAALDDLAARGVISVRWQRFRSGEAVEALYLEDPAALYRLLGRTSPSERRDELLAVLDEPPWSRDELAPLAEQFRVQLREHHPTVVQDPADLRDVGRIFLLSPEDCRGYAVRALSVRLFGDSKRLEALLRPADRLSEETFGEPLSPRLGLTRSFPEVTICVFGTLGVAAESWRLSGEPVTLPAETLGTVSTVELDRPPATGSPWVLSVENKESFYAACDAARAAWSAPRSAPASPPSALLFTAGHPGPAIARAAALLGKTAAATLHFGDMDPDGLLILEELERSSGVSVRPFSMDVDTFQRYAAFGRPLSRQSRDRLRHLTHPELQALAKTLEERGIGVEQEVIPVSF